ncbi:Kunitz-type trypsin inhibitor-like 1 protein, partial [Mucuna pruriens]
MKAVLLLTLSFLFASLTNLPLAFSKNDGELVRDTYGNPLYSGHPYRILGKDDAAVGLMSIPVTSNENICPVNVTFKTDFPVIFKGPDVGFIYIGTPLDINFTENNIIDCKNHKWSVFKDDKIKKRYVGVQGEQLLSGKFSIQKDRSQQYNSYKLVFHPEYLPIAEPIDIGTYDNTHNERRLVLTADEPYQVLFEYVPDKTTKKSVSNGTLTWIVGLRRDERLG